MKIKNRVKVPEQDANIRVKNFDEVCLGYTKEQAIKEANRCLQCKNPLCVQGCPVNVRIPEFIQLIKNGDFDTALSKIKETNNLPGVCGRVCPQEKQCEAKCILGIKGEAVAIGKLERFVADYGKNKKIIKKKPNGKKIAIIGSGPSGLTCANDLNILGYDVTIFEALHLAGGVLAFGIPKFRLPVKILNEEIKAIIDSGVKIKTDYVIGRTLTMEQLSDEFNAIFIANGAGLPYFMNIPGEELVNVYSANEFLTRVNLMHANDFPNNDTPITRAKKTVVVGAGNVAMDAARTARRLGSEIILVYRRTKKEAPARVEEITHAEEEGIKFKFLYNPVEILGDKKVTGIKLQKMQMGKPDESGRARPEPLDEFEKIDCDQVIIAIGQGPNPILTNDTDLKVNHGRIIVNSKFQTNNAKVFSGGDIIGGETTAIKAMGDGKKAAVAIDEFLNK